MLELTCTVRLTSTIAGAFSTARGIDCSLPVYPLPETHTHPAPRSGGKGEGEGGAASSTTCVQAFGIPPAEASALRLGGWVGSVDAGSSVNCPTLSACFHGVGTHTECAGHALPGHVALFKDVHVPAPLMTCLVLTVDTVALAECGDAYAVGKPTDMVVCSRQLQAAYERVVSMLASPCEGEAQARVAVGRLMEDGAVVIRTRPNGDFKRTANYGGADPAYCTPAVMHQLLHWKAQHVVVDLPSVDRESDEGQLLSHRVWWQLPARGSPEALGVPASVSQRTITELAYVPDAVEDGAYMLNLCIAPIVLDAAPSRPVLHALTLNLTTPVL